MKLIETNQLNDFLHKLGACSEAVQWTKDYDSLPSAWAACERADWMMWLVGKMADKPGWPTRKQVVSLACDFAEDVLPIYEKKYPDNKRVRDCIATIRKWVNGEATIEDVRKARADAAYAAYAAAYAAYAAAYAADAAYADAAAYAADAWRAVREKKLKEFADLIRQKLQIPEAL